MIGKLTRTILRTFAFALTLCATSGAWAADSLEETGGFVSSSSTLAFKGVSLSELTADTLSARMAGSWVSAKGTAVTFCGLSLSGSTLTCEAQMYEATTDFTGVKSIYLTFSQDGDDINVQATNVKSLSGGTLGTPVGSGGSSVNGGVPASTYTGNGYGLYNLSLTRSWSDSAVVIWEAGQFGVLSKTGSDGNTYTLDANGNSVAANASSITINQSVGVKVDSSAALTSGMTVLVRYSDLNLSLGSAQTLVNSSIDSDGTATGNGNGNRTGVYIDSSGASQGLWAGNTCTSANGVSQTSHTFVATETSGVMAFSYYSASQTDSNLGTHLWYLSNGTRSALYNLKTLGSTSDGSIYGCVIGGPRGSTTNGGPATGMKITGIAIFKGVLSESQMTSFVWPSAAAAEYAKWSYASYVLTCNSGFSNFESPNYSTFDLKSGYDIMPTYTTSVAPVKWQCFGYSTASGFDSTAYTAPGNVLRFVDASHACVAKFSPLTIGGMIVESTATGCSLANSDGTRSTIFGDPTANAETWFKFDTSFSMARTGAYAIMGTVNLEINNSASVTFSGEAQISGAGEKAAGTNPSHTAGGVLKLHGNGSMAISSIDASDATLDYTDLSATSSTAAGAYIQGTLTVNDNTVIALPAGATFPYFVATGISGVLDTETGVTIGGVTYQNYVAMSDGSIIYSAPAEVTISSDAAWGSGVLDGWTTGDATKNYVINVTGDATLTLGSDVSLNRLTLNVSENATLTISGGNTITAGECIYLTGDGVTQAGASNTFSGVIKGNGTVQYPSKTLPTGATWTNDEWEGTLIIVQCGKTNNSSHGYIDFASYGSVNSFIKATSFKGYTTQSTTANATYCAATLVIDKGDTFTLNNGDGSKSCVFKALTGSGTLALSGSGTATTQYIFRDVSGFTGTVTISDNAKKSIVLGASSSWTPNFSDYQKKLVIAGDVTIAEGKTWTADGGIVVAASGSLTVAGNTTTPITVNSGGSATVSGTASGAITDNGTLTLGDAATVSGAISGSGEVVCTVLPDNAGLADSSGWTGTVTVNGVAYASVAKQSATQFMNANSKLVVAAPKGVVMPYVWLTSASGLTGEVSVQDTATLFVTDDTSSTISLKVGTLDGTINLGSCVATTLNLSLGTKRPDSARIVYPTGLTTLNIAATELLSEDGAATFRVAGLSSLTTTTMTLTKLDGTVENLTGTVEDSTLTFSWTPSVSGAACWVDYEMNGSNANTGTEGTAFSYDGYTAENSFYDSKFLYTYTHPYRNNLDDYPDSWTAVVRCTVPNLANAAIITFGNQTSGLIGLIAGDNPGSEMKLIQTTGSSAYSTKATMTVQDATSAQHVYVFAVENKRTLKCWCDGTQVLNENLAADVSIGNGFQIGSVVYGVGNTGIVRWWPGDTAFDNLDADVKTAARIDCLRLYKGVLGPNAIAQLSVEFPAVKLFQATIAGGDANVWDSLSWTGGDISTLDEYSKIILTVTDDATLTLPSTVTAEEFTINVTAGKTLTLLQAAGGTTFTLTNPIEVNNGSLQFPDDATIDFAINGTGTVRVGSGETLNLVDGGSVPGLTGAGTLDCSSMSALPGAFTFNSWTGTVELPSFSASSGVNFNSYGTTGSTVALAGMTEGYILEVGKTVAPTLRLDGAMKITAMSSWTYTFAEITGTGNLSFSTSANSPTVVITKVAEGYSGTISSTLANRVTITTLARPAGQSKAGGTKLLTISGSFNKPGTVTIGETTLSPSLVRVKDDGIYIGYGTIFSVY